MNVPKNEIRVYYKHDDRIVEAWDSAIETTLGFRRWASGFNYLTGIRDLAFEKGGRNETYHPGSNSVSIRLRPHTVRLDRISHP
uniref:Uncharacterized protein n=1 Tax=viral metagenome TaxID=1070528 RepID=A0A6H2A1S2_9ZZZZ